jgi:hypothetical protein
VLSKLDALDLTGLFDPRRQLTNVSAVFKRLGLVSPEDRRVPATGDA